MTEATTPSHSSTTAALLKGKKRSSGPSWPIVLAIVFLLIALVAAAGAWFQQKRFEKVGREFATQVQSLTAQVNDTRRESSQALSLSQSQASRITKLEQTQLEAKNQFDALEQVWQGANKGIEDAMLANDIDRLLSTANQQLRLSGNVNNAIITLEAALSTLTRADRPRFASVQRAISLDLDRLRAVPLVDIPALSKRLEGLSVLVARAPLLLPDAAAPNVTPNEVASSASAVPVPSTSAQSLPSQSTPAQSPQSSVAETLPVTDAARFTEAFSRWWSLAVDGSIAWSKSAAAVLAREFADVVSIQRVSDANALLMSPEQGSLLRANLRTRVLTAQMALLMHQAPVWQAELAAIEQSLMSRYDPKAPDTLAALRLVRELAAIQIAVPLPDINGSLAALESVRASEPPSAGGQ
ncbi:uroporphyrinogen-III C-methyltransferase [Zwartia sp.]|uniref:uroporphyrinogen-III C-methyltransferase n=1 Tax=Zwartia sp. TaxID=2978004 RepID=UPI00271FCB0A|nr:uroporphyrinogen-III C-methyltransferase [Zwartia sp.]MDO9023752.1 uroporphyrinogen-III C-methyltransferase [Zwartia sp.]